ncbi:ABC transporter ATP-binding protein [Alcanivorax nanhaiticus]|uniref:ABC transporter ATP-binding protein n=1 Tax=Alcanivorax nanhaiticus TaxID=1177154 RepID=A0A095SFS5_9GAMM|nr:ATP-binding cassette domain-containing protein [Alcanivorax nanhaiticus]KGD63174.1 ABC transporter ATP-binding protein [Alcanivorax nanhaiticus]
MFQFEQARLGHPGQAVFENLTLHIAKGEHVALLGPSGSGKSTLLAALRQQQADRVAWCPQDADLVPMLSVFHNIYMGALDRQHSLINLRNLIWPSRHQKSAIGEIAAQLGLAEKLFTSVDKLSGGQAQRVALGRAIYSQRQVLLADEPVSSVDEHQGLALLKKILGSHPTAVIALHDRSLALQCCSRVIGLRDGVIALDAPCDSLSLADLDALYQ